METMQLRRNENKKFFWSVIEPKCKRSKHYFQNRVREKMGLTSVEEF
jgi:hypothetical protein